MDNITHSLVGVALADLAMGRRATKSQRPLFVGAGIIAANLPDLDLAYSWITAAPLGYLLHHRGHSHTVGGLVVLAAALAVAYWFFPSVRKMRVSGQLRFWSLIAVALASHLALDWLNSYGVHPFFPFDSSWYYGDSVFILEPSLWVVLGVAVAFNARTRGARLAVALPLLVLVSTTASTGAIPWQSAAVLAAGAVTFGLFVRRWAPSTRAAAAFAVLSAIVAGFASTSRIARAEALQALSRDVHGEVIDVILTPNPSSPVCWSVLAIELRRAGDEYVLWRGTLSLAPDWKAPTACASHQFDGPENPRIVGNGHFALRDATHQPLQRLRALAKDDCWVRAWLRFGRAPVIDRGSIFDLRFSDRPGREFTDMRLNRRDGCPSNVPGWAMPRADLLR